METFDAIIPAGGTLDAAFAAQVGTSAKALIHFQGESFLAHTLKMLRESGVVHRVVVVGSQAVQDEALANGASLATADVGSGPDNILKGLAELGGTTERVLVITSDLPFVTADGIRAFIQECPPSIDFCVPVIRKQEFEARFPGSSSMFVPLEADQWTLGGVFLINAQALRKAQPHIERVFQNRKSMVGMAKLLGPVFLVKFLLKRLSLPDVKTKIEQILDSTGYVVTNAPPEFAYDVDDAEDFDYAMKSLKGAPNNV